MGDGRRVKTGDGSIQVIEAEFVHGLAELGADPEHGIRLVDDEKAMGAPDAVSHRLDVERLNGPEIDDLGGDAALGQDVGGLERPDDELSGARDGEVGPLPGDPCDAERHEMLAFRHRPLRRRTAPSSPA